MKIRDSDMPELEQWEGFFDIPLIIEKMKLAGHHEVIEYGCGYGTFTLPIAKVIKNYIYALEIDEEKLVFARERVAESGWINAVFIRQDFEADGSDMPDNSADYCVLFNILHGEDPEKILRDAYTVLKPGKTAGVIHWRHDPATPRGPAMDIRPRPEQMLSWVKEAGFHVEKDEIIDLPPWHYGILGTKPLV